MYWIAALAVLSAVALMETRRLVGVGLRIERRIDPRRRDERRCRRFPARVDADPPLPGLRMPVEH